MLKLAVDTFSRPIALFSWSVTHAVVPSVAMYSGSRSWAVVGLLKPKSRTGPSSGTPPKRGGADLRIPEPTVEVDHGDRALRVDRVEIVRLALVGHEQRATVGREGQHVRERAGRDHLRALVAVAVEQDHGPWRQSWGSPRPPRR